MLRKVLLLVLVLGFCTATSAHAGFFAGAAIGYTKIDDNSNNLNFSSSATAYKAYGGFNIMKFFGVEGSYVNFGSPSDSGFKVDLTGWDIYGVGHLPLGKRFEIFGKYGWMFWNSKVSGGGSSASENDHDAAYGAGVTFNLMKHLGIRGEYTKYQIGGVDKSDIGWLGADFQF